MQHLPLDDHGLLLRRTAIELGLDDNWLARMVRLRVLVRIRHGAYADADVWRRLTPAGRHLLRSRAVMLQYDDRVALSHASAHVLRGGPDWGLDLTNVNITNLHGRGDRVQAGITHHRGATFVTDVSRFNDHWVTAPARTAVETAAGLGLAAAVCVLDWTLHQGLTRREELELYAGVWLREWPGSVNLPAAVAASDGRSESVGETRSRLILEDLGFEPEPQWEVRLPSGRVAGRVDLLLRRQGAMVEFDGQVKYGRLLKPGQRIEDVVKAEREREVLLEELTGLRILRLVWGDLSNPAEIGARVQRIVAQRRAG
ncbi:hypothetical protein [Nocardioides sp. URHA0020]|uniref:hypothetical protein n=1 Tax=Nocardioides sp. URHA0020 TaxID=1380392 RepID=UPI00048D05BB|nr:hypothetical protein [Nocardioides sp. URHA0020]